MSLYQQISELLATQGNNAKIEVIQKFKGDALFIDYLSMMYSPRLNFYIQKYNMPDVDGNDDFGNAHLDMMQEFYNREVTGNAAITRMDEIASSLNSEGKLLLGYLIDRGLRGGIGIRMINKAMGCEFIWDADSHYMRCSLPSDKISAKIDWSNMVSQPKLDGGYYEVGSSIGIRTRAGNTFHPDCAPIDKSIVESIDGILMGEIVIYENGNPLPRKISNGMMNSLMQGTPLEPQYQPIYHVWDWKETDGKQCDINYVTRLNKVQEIVKDFRPSIVVVQSYNVRDMKHAIELAANEIAQGGEGTVIKSLSMKWKSGTSKEQIKIKTNCDVDLKAVELVPGDANGKHADTFGSVRCVSSDGRLAVNVSGLSDALRLQIFENPDIIIGKVVTITFNDITTSRTSGDEASLFLPRFGKKSMTEIIIRDDKTEADSLDRIYEIFETTTGISRKINE